MTGILKVDTIQKNNGATPTAADLGLNVSGNILQVKQTYVTSRVSISNTSDTGIGADVGLNVTITPKSSTSYFLVQVHIGAVGMGGSFGSWGAILSKNNNRIGNGNAYGGYDAGVLFRGVAWSGDYNHTSGGGSASYLDTTYGTIGTPITYKVGLGVQNNGASAVLNSDYNQYSGTATFAHSTTSSSITVMEIAA